MLKFLWIILILPAITFAQKSPVKFGDIPMEDMTMNVYDKDSSASAVVLADYGVAYLSENGVSNIQFNMDRHKRIKILKKEALGKADVVISLRAGDKVTALKATTYNLEGGKMVETKLPKEGIFKESINRNYDQQKFTFSNVKEGSIIEYSYKIISESGGYDSWKFQNDCPTRVSEYWAMVPRILIFEQYMQGYVPVDSYQVTQINYFGQDVKAHHWISKDVPAFKEEPYMTCESDFVSRINFALSHIVYPSYTKEVMGSWEKLREDLLASEQFGKVITGGGFLQDKANEITSGMTDPLQKIAAISNYIKSTVAYDGTEDFEALALKKVVEKKKGSAGDINLLYASMLEKAGLDVDMILLSTRDHGFIRQQYPMTSQFNYVICSVTVGDKRLLLDATEKYLPYDVLPGRCLNGQGFIVSKINTGWVNIVSKAKAKTIVSTELKLNPEGELKGKLEYLRDGYDAASMRESFGKKGEETYVKDFVKSNQWQIEKSQFQDVKETTKQVKETHEISIAEHTSVAGDIIYVNPFITGQIEENPFKSDARQYPVDFGNASDKTYMAKIIVPEGYVVDELPKNKILTLPANAGKFLYSSSQLGNTVSIVANFQINKTIFTQDEYGTLKEFYSQVIAKEAEQIVVKKK